jgi:hypothetical protein
MVLSFKMFTFHEAKSLVRAFFKYRINTVIKGDSPLENALILEK